MENLTDKEIVEQTNRLARRFYQMQGYIVDKKYKFYKATHPQEMLCWRMACAAQDVLTATDVEGNIDLDEY